MEIELGAYVYGSRPSESLIRLVEEMRSEGYPRFEWDLLKPLLSSMLTQRLEDFRAEFPDKVADDRNQFEMNSKRLVAALDMFEGAPFTLQRLCELILSPKTYYKSTTKLVFGLEKLLSVSSILDVHQENSDVAQNNTIL